MRNLGPFEDLNKGTKITLVILVHCTSQNEYRLDKCESNHTGYGQTDAQTITEVSTGKIYEFVRSNVTTPGFTERRTLMTRVSRNVVH